MQPPVSVTGFELMLLLLPPLGMTRAQLKSQTLTTGLSLFVVLPNRMFASPVNRIKSVEKKTMAKKTTHTSPCASLCGLPFC
jgi:hypothetical protein